MNHNQFESLDNLLFLLENVVKLDQNRQPILKGINAKVMKGEFITIIGPSGSGKSTLLSLFNRLTDPDKGNIHYSNRPIKDYNVLEIRKRIGMAFQQPFMVKGTVYDNLLLGPKLHKQQNDQQDLKRLLLQMGLSEEILSQNASSLSGGQKQKVALARLLLNEPEVLLLDEVTASLDPTSTMEIEAYIKKLHVEKKITVLWITHNMEQAERIGEYTWVINDGKIVEQGETRKVLTNPTSDATKSLIAFHLGKGEK